MQVDFVIPVNDFGLFREVEVVLLVGENEEASVSYTHLRAHETVLDLVCRLLLEKKKKQITSSQQ